MRKLLYLLLAMLLLGKVEAAHACVVGADDYEQSHAWASTVFVGHIVRTEEAGTIWRWDRLQSEPAVEATFRVVGVLKGQPPVDGKVRLLADRTCNVDLLAGQTYAIFLYHRNIVWGPNEGTTRLWHAQDIDAKRLLEQLREQREEGAKRVKEMYRAIREGKVDDCWVGFLDKEAVAKSTNIFVGHLTRTEEVELARIGDTPPTPVVEGKFRVLEVMRGHAPQDGTVRTSHVRTPCPDPDGSQPSLVPGSDYIVFLGQDNFIGAVWIGHYSNEWPRWLEEYGVESRKAQ